MEACTIAFLAGAAAAGGAGLLARLLSRTRHRTEEHPQEWIFIALAHGRRDLVVKGDPDINWNEPHSHYGAPLHAVGGAGIRLDVHGWDGYCWTSEADACMKDLLALFEFAIKRGADPTVVCPASCAGCVSFTMRYDDGGVLWHQQEHVGGRSALSLWLAFSQKAKEFDARAPEQLPLASSFFDGILSLLLHVIPKHQGCMPKRLGRKEQLAMAEVPEATAAMWQRMMRNEEACDVVLQCSDGEVRVHSVVVACSSKVLSAMLNWPRGETVGPWELKLEERKAVVEAWRVLVYTGLPPQEGLATDLLLEVLDLSHRWQDHLLECGLLTAALAKRVVDGESCIRVLDAALARDLPELRSECLAFARRSREVRRDWEHGRFAGEVSSQLGAVLGVARRGDAAQAASTRRWDL